MDTVDRIHCIDDSRSHVNGIAPFIPFGVSSTTVSYVTSSMTEGNRFGYVCDFAKVDSCLCGETDTYIENVVINNGQVGEEARLRYSTVLRKYNFIKARLREGYYGKVVVKTESEFVSMDCNGQAGGECAEPDVTSETGTSIFVASRFDELVDPYDFILLDAGQFSQFNSVAMKYTGPDDEIPAELVDGAFVVLIDGYDKAMEYDADWDGWWLQWFGTGWETEILDEDYVTPSMYKFVRDFETYIIGKAIVPSKFNVDGETLPVTGASVPKEVYFLDLDSLLAWYSENDVPNKTGQVKRTWDDHGGDAFYAWLKTIEPKYITEPEDDVTDCVERFLFVPPYSPFDVVLVDRHEYERLYDSYLVDEKPFEATGQFSGYSQFIDSHFVEMTDSGMVESKLVEVKEPDVTVVNGIEGVWLNFPSSGDPAVFRCVYHTAPSLVTGTTVTKRLNYDNGSYKEENITPAERDFYEQPPKTTSGPDRVVLVSKTKVETPDDIEVEPETAVTQDHLSATTYTSAYTSFNYGWFECYRVDPDQAASILCADGEIVHADSQVYRSVTLLAVIPRLITDTLSEGDIYYFSVKHDNGYDFGKTVREVTYSNPTSLKPFSIPFKAGSFHSMYKVNDEGLYTGNYIPEDGITIDSGTCTLNYVVGGKAMYDEATSAFTEVPNTGIRYTETHPYTRISMDRITVDGYDHIPFYYEKIDLSSTAEPAYSDELRMTRMANRARISGMEIATIWTSGTAITAKLVTKDYSAIFNDSRLDVDDVEVDRGNAAAFDGYFRLSECNTLEDIENYGNNRFQI